MKCGSAGGTSDSSATSPASRTKASVASRQRSAAAIHSGGDASASLAVEDKIDMEPRAAT